jgi:hypothetical protein
MDINFNSLQFLVIEPIKGTSKNSKISFSLREKVGMRGLKSIIYIPHPSPLPVGEGIFRGSLKEISNNWLHSWFDRHTTDVTN